MANLAFYVVRQEADAINTAYGQYMQKIQALELELQSSIAAFYGLSDSVLGGAAGTAMKNYMDEVHRPLIDNISLLVSQLLTDYAASYLSKLQTNGAGVYETAADDFGRYPTGKLNSVSSDLGKIHSGSLSDAVSDLNKAKRSIPEGMSFSFPSELSIATMLENQSVKVISLKTSIESAENAGRSVISSESGVLGDLFTKVSTAITHYASEVGPITSYESGSFSVFAGAIGLRESYKAASMDQSRKMSTVLASEKTSIKCVKKGIQKKEAAEAKKKKGWLIFGTIASVGVAVAGMCAIVATGGAAAPLVLFYGLSVGKDLVDIENRVTQILDVSSGDYMAQRQENLLDSASDAKTAAESGYSSWKLSDALGGGGDSLSEVVGNEAGSLTATFGKMAVDMAFDGIKASTDDPAAGLVADVTSEVVSEGIDAYKDYLFDGSIGMGGPIGTLCECGTIVADYGASRCDEELAALDAEDRQLDDLQDNFGINWNTSTAVNW